MSTQFLRFYIIGVQGNTLTYLAWVRVNPPPPPHCEPVLGILCVAFSTQKKRGKRKPLWHWWIINSFQMLMLLFIPVKAQHATTHIVYHKLMFQGDSVVLFALAKCYSAFVQSCRIYIYHWSPVFKWITPKNSPKNNPNVLKKGYWVILGLLFRIILPILSVYLAESPVLFVLE